VLAYIEDALDVSSFPSTRASRCYQRTADWPPVVALSRERLGPAELGFQGILVSL
jgi:hypothetical protein